jgi:hypothetical protein
MSVVKDSGSTREFSTGAHRDNATGKGRCDLLPLKEVALIMEDKVLENISKFEETYDKSYLVQAVRLARETISEYEGNFSTMFIETSKLYEDGANKYGENNWKNGMPISCYIDSGIRHYLKTLRKDEDEPHWRGFVWNMLGALWSINNVPGSLEEYKEQTNAYKVK